MFKKDVYVERRKRLKDKLKGGLGQFDLDGETMIQEANIIEERTVEEVKSGGDLWGWYNDASASLPRSYENGGQPKRAECRCQQKGCAGQINRCVGVGELCKRICHDQWGQDHREGGRRCQRALQFPLGIIGHAG